MAYEMSKIEAEVATVRNDNEDIESMFSEKEIVGCNVNQLRIQNNITAIHQENEGVCQDNYDLGF